MDTLPGAIRAVYPPPSCTSTRIRTRTCTSEPCAITLSLPFTAHRHGCTIPRGAFSSAYDQGNACDFLSGCAFWRWQRSLLRLSQRNPRNPRNPRNQRNRRSSSMLISRLALRAAEGCAVCRSRLPSERLPPFDCVGSRTADWLVALICTGMCPLTLEPAASWCPAQPRAFRPTRSSRRWPYWWAESSGMLGQLVAFDCLRAQPCFASTKRRHCLADREDPNPRFMDFVDGPISACCSLARSDSDCGCSCPLRSPFNAIAT